MKPTPTSITLFIVVVGIGGLVLGFLQLRSHISGPFNSVTESSSGQTLAQDDLLELRDLDTDRDTLSDFDELYLYDTSPYLADSDSDGSSDAQEIETGEDPNCPRGQVCRSVPADTNQELANIFNINTDALNLNANANTNTTAPANPSPEEVPLSVLRTTLIGAGVPEDTINNLDDETLRALYGEALAQESSGSNQNASPASNINTNSGTETPLTDDVTVTELLAMDATEIRNLLIASGVPSATLGELDDATLKAIFEEAVSENIQNP
ncbi:MAG: hypothetical protein Q8Q20_05150 [bacterium]|nr:hypothetical protein [bacterium]